MTTTAKPNQLDDYVFKALTLVQLHEKNKVKEAYARFWSSTKFKKGWEKPPCALEEVSDLLDTAAEAVVRIRSHLDEKNPSPKFRTIDGSAQEYLHELRSKPKHARRFIKALVRANFRHQKGYVEGLSAKDIDGFLEKFWGYRQATQDSHRKDVRAKLQEAWDEASFAMKQLLESDLFSVAEASALTDEDVAQIQSLITTMNNIHKNAEHLTIKQHRMEEDQKSQGSEEDHSGLATPESEMETTSEQKGEGAEQATPNEGEQTSDEATKNENLITLQVLSQDVANLKTSITNLAEQSSKLDLEKLVATDGAEKLVEDLQKKCLHYAEGLMNDLFKLDSIVNAPDFRAQRKEQVKNVQNMMEQVDSVKLKLHDLLKQLREQKAHRKAEEDEKRKKEEEQRRKEEEEQQKKEEEEQRKREEEEQRKRMKLEELKQEQAQLAQELALEEKKRREQYLQKRDSRLQEKWSKLKLQPKLEVEETREGFIIQGYIPGMKKEDIKVRLSKESHTLTLEGVRVPTPVEEEQLRQQIKLQLKQNPQLSFQLDRLTKEDEDMLVLRSGLGRFGRFSETYRLPSSVTGDGIEATYEKGVLNVVIPKKVVRPQARPRSPSYGQHFGQFGPLGWNDPFVLDEDNWW